MALKNVLTGMVITVGATVTILSGFMLDASPTLGSTGGDSGHSQHAKG